MTSSLRLRDGETGHDGSASYGYAGGLGTLDACNGHDGPTPEFPGGISHHRTTRVNAEGHLSFPYFLLCYRSVAEASNFDTGGGPLAAQVGGVSGMRNPRLRRDGGAVIRLRSAVGSGTHSQPS